AGNGAVALPIGGMLRASFGKCVRQEVRSVAAEHHARRIGCEDVRVKRIARGFGLGEVYQPAVFFRPQGAVDKPFLKPDGLQRACRDFRYQSLSVRRTEGPESDLSARVDIRVARVERRTL